MSFTEEKRELIKKYILEKIQDGESDIAGRTADSFGISLNTVYRYIHEMEGAGIIKKHGRLYELSESSREFQLYRSNGDLAGEDIIYDKYIDTCLKNFPKDVRNIWEYAFTEMMNNAIDHSDAEVVNLTVRQNALSTAVIIADRGVGIFKKIKEFFSYDSTDDAIEELFKGKLTTDTANHSGEGIFFTSRVMDRFTIVSDGRVFTLNKYDEVSDHIEDIKLKNLEAGEQGTTVYMELSNNSKKILREVFDAYADPDGGFTKTRIPIKNIFGDYPVSRSQAQRLCHRLDDFSEVELDFDSVPEIGQGFAHEIFVVFQGKNEDVIISPVNANDAVAAMIRHVKNSDRKTI